MLNTMVRIGFVFFGILMLLDTLLPGVTQSVQITDHMISSATRGRADRHKLYFNNGQSGNCIVDKTAFEELKDGDEVVVQDTRLLKRCVRIERNGDLIYSYTYWIFLSLLLGVGFIAYGMGWLKFRKN